MQVLYCPDCGSDVKIYVDAESGAVRVGCECFAEETESFFEALDNADIDEDDLGSVGPDVDPELN